MAAAKMITQTTILESMTCLASVFSFASMLWASLLVSLSEEERSSLPLRDNQKDCNMFVEDGGSRQSLTLHQQKQSMQNSSISRVCRRELI